MIVMRLNCTIDACLSDVSMFYYAGKDYYKCGSLIQVRVLTYFHPYETAFDVMDNNDKTIMNGGPCVTSNNYQASSKYSPVETLQFNMHDDFK